MNRPALIMPAIAVGLSLAAAFVCGGASPAHARQQAQKKKAAPAAKAAPVRKAAAPAPGKKVAAPGKKVAAPTKARAAKTAAGPGSSHHRRGLAHLGRLTPNATASNSSLRLTSKLGPVGKTGTSPLDRWSMTRQKQTARSWKKANERDNRGRSVLPPP